MKNKSKIFLIASIRVGSLILISASCGKESGQPQPISTQSLYYYAFEEKIPLSEVDNKLIVRFDRGEDKIANAIYINNNLSLGTSQQWNDDRTVTITTSSKLDKVKIVVILVSNPTILSIHSMYQTDSGLEMGVTDEFLVDFKKEVTLEMQHELNMLWGGEVLKKTEIFQLIRVHKSRNALDVANKYQESGLVNFSHPNFISQIELN